MKIRREKTRTNKIEDMTLCFPVNFLFGPRESLLFKLGIQINRLSSHSHLNYLDGEALVVEDLPSEVGEAPPDPLLAQLLSETLI